VHFLADETVFIGIRIERSQREFVIAGQNEGGLLVIGRLQRAVSSPDGAPLIPQLGQKYEVAFALAPRQLMKIELNADSKQQTLVAGKLRRRNFHIPADLLMMPLRRPAVKRDALKCRVRRSGGAGCPKREQRCQSGDRNPPVTHTV